MSMALLHVVIVTSVTSTPTVLACVPLGGVSFLSLKLWVVCVLKEPGFS